MIKTMVSDYSKHPFKEQCTIYGCTNKKQWNLILEGTFCEDVKVAYCDACLINKFGKIKIKEKVRYTL